MTLERPRKSTAKMTGRLGEGGGVGAVGGGGMQVVVGCTKIARARGTLRSVLRHAAPFTRKQTRKGVPGGLIKRRTAVFRFSLLGSFGVGVRDFVDPQIWHR